MDHLDSIRHRIRSAPVSEPPVPWKRIGEYAVGGLIEVGFADESDLLLVVSSQGRGVFDCRSGDRIARDSAPPEDSWYDERRLRAIGIGLLAGREIRMAGLHGGGLSRSGLEGWSVEDVTLDWPARNLILVEPWKWIYDNSARFTKLMKASEVRAFGFSETGRSLSIATSCELTIYRLLEESQGLSRSMQEEGDHRLTTSLESPPEA